MSQNNDFKKLKTEWYQKLKDEGFNDIETEDNKYLKTWENLTWENKYLPSFMIDQNGNIKPFMQFIQETQRYYELAGMFLHDHLFKNEFEKKVWELHSEGFSMRESIPKLKGYAKKIYLTKLFLTLKKLKKVFLMNYIPEHENLE